jgi:sarcosine oxidase subunit beta
MTRGVPDRAQVVIVGGGVIGCSIALHLAEAGVRDVVVVESGPLGAGSTSKAAGGVRASFSHPTNVAMGLRGLDVYSRFAELYGQQIDFCRSGYLYCLSDEDSLASFAESVALQNAHGVPSRLVSPEEARQISPVISTDGMLAAVWSPSDGRATPESVVMGYAAAARRHGARFLTHCPVLAVETDGAAVSAVVTAAGTIRTRTVVCAAGAWSAAIGRMVGTDLPVTPFRRQVAFTAAMADLPRQLPLTVDFPSTFYFHPEGRGLLFGWSDPAEPAGFNVRFELTEWLERVAVHAGVRAPQILEQGIVGGWAGLYEVTPDHNQIIGRSADVDGFLYATGFSGHGFLMGPATGEIVRDLFLDREPTYDISGFDVRRFDAVRSGRTEHNIV